MSSSLLLRLFESEYFNVHLAISYLKTHSSSIGITYYLVNRLAQFPESEVEIYWPQLCHLLITRPSESAALEGFIGKRCEESIHLAMLTLWQLQASLTDLSATPNTPQFAVCKRLLNRIQHIIFSDPLVESGADATLARERISERIEPAMAGLGIAAAAIAMPFLAGFSGKMAIEEGKREKSVDQQGYAGSPLLPGNASSSGSEDEEDDAAFRASVHRQQSPIVTVGSPTSPSSRASLDPASSPPRQNGSHPLTMSPSSSFKASRAKSTKLAKTPSYLPGPPLSRTIPPSTAFASQPRSSYSPALPSARNFHSLNAPNANVGASRSMTNLSSPTSGTFDAEGSQPETPKVSFYSSGSTSSPTKSARTPGSARPETGALALPFEHHNRHARSTPSFHPSASTSNLHRTPSSSSSTKSIPPHTLETMLRSYACRSQLDLLTSLQDISTRLVVVPKMARLSALRAELTVLNHGLPRGCCLCIYCPGAGGGSILSGASNSSKSASSSSIFSAHSSTQASRAHHRIVRISPSESVVLNSADRAPFLMHVEVLEGDLDFDPSRRQNAEDVRAVTGEREANYKSRTNSAAGNLDYHTLAMRSKSQDTYQSSRAASPNSEDGNTNLNTSFNRSPSARSTPHISTPQGISEVDGNDIGSESLDPSSQDEEVDLVEQLYGSFSVKDAPDMSDFEYHPKIHNRAADEEAWRRAEARKSLSLPSDSHALSTASSPTTPSSRKALTIDEYAERMRMAAIMLAQLSASQQLPMSSTDAVTGVVGAGVGMGVNLTYGVGSVVGSVLGVGMDVVRAGLGGGRRDSNTSGVSAPVVAGTSAANDQGTSGVSAPLDTASAATGLSDVAGSPHNGLPGSELMSANPSANGTSPATSLQQQRQRILPPQAAAAIKERIMSEMMALEEERMARMRASSRTTGKYGATHGESAEEESVVMRAINKEDPSGAVFQESWPEKKMRIRKSSPYGHLANWDVFSVIVKTGADLRQEQLAVQIIKEFGRIWTETKCPHWIRYFRILVTSESTGLIETITDAVSVHSLKKDAYAKLAANNPSEAGYLPSYTLYDYFLETYGEPNSSAYRKAQDAFMKSLASYSIISYLLQIKDRHNGNILIDKLGHVIHIDFGFLLSNSPGSLGFEMAPFKLTQDYIDILGGLDSPKFLEYRTLLKRQFREVRRHAERIINLVELMQTDSKLPCFSTGELTSQHLRDRFQLTLPVSQMEEYVDKLIISSAGSAFTRLYDTFQRHSQGVL